MRATEIIELVGSEVTWELINADGTWYVWAQHRSGDPYTSFKFQEGGESLDYCVRRVANDVLAWQKEQGWPLSQQEASPTVTDEQDARYARAAEYALAWRDAQQEGGE